MRIALFVLFATVIQLAGGNVSAEPVCRVVQRGNRVEMISPQFVFRVDTSSGLRALSWDNRLTGRTVPLGLGPVTNELGPHAFGSIPDPRHFLAKLLLGQHLFDVAQCIRPFAIVLAGQWPALLGVGPAS